MWGDRLRGYRAANKLVQKELAHKLGVDVMTLSRWERGLTTPNASARRLIEATIGQVLLPDGAMKRLIMGHERSCYLMDQNGVYLAANKHKAATMDLSPADLAATDFFRTARSEQIKDSISDMGGYLGMLDRGFVGSEVTVNIGGLTLNTITEVMDIAGHGRCFLVTQVDNLEAPDDGLRFDIRMQDGKRIPAIPQKFTAGP